MVLRTIWFSTLFLGSTVQAEPAVKNLQMTPGETISVQYPAGSEVKVSRRGVVDVFAVSETAWQLTALRGGLVIVDASDTNGTPQLPRLFIDVKSANGTDRLPVAIGIPDWICRGRSTRCDPESGNVTGVIDDYRWYLIARSWCYTSRNCRLFTRLTERARTDLETFIRDRLAKDLNVSVSVPGEIGIIATCDPLTAEHHRQAIETAFPHMLDNKVMAFTCAAGQSSYRITVKARKISHSNGQTIGFDRDIDQTINSKPAIHTTFKFKNSLKNEQLDTKAETIGEPTFLATDGIEFSALIGGELPYATTTANNNEEYRWKEYGLSVKGMIKGSQGAIIRSSIEVFLKSVHDQPSKGLNTSSLKSNFETVEGRWLLIGELDLNSEISNESSTMFLTSLPIIGPLFRLNQKSKSNTKLQTWIKIERADPANSDFNDDIKLHGLPAEGKIGAG